MTGSNELSPCPFCGGAAYGPAEIMDGAPFGSQEVYCVGYTEHGPGCGATVGPFDTKELARDGWNRRSDQPPVDPAPG